MAMGPRRIGHGFDAHAFAATEQGDGALVLGGVRIPHDRALAGHSDADVILHALIDALLGAAALGDIGGMFPSSDERWRGADSRDLLGAAYGRLRDAGFQAANVDVTVVAEEPKLASHIAGMRDVIAGTLGLDITAVSVKATTSDGLGFTGRGEGIAAFAVVLIQ